MITLRPDQSALIARVREAMQQYRSVLMQAPTGWGKTVVFSWLASQVQARSKSVIIVVHRDELLDQVSRTQCGPIRCRFDMTPRIAAAQVRQSALVVPILSCESGPVAAAPLPAEACSELLEDK